MSEIPDRVGRYRVERMLGQGAMGSVYLARDPELHRAVAIKIVRKLDISEDRLQTFLERFRNEARAAARLSHPSIVAVYDVGEDDDAGPYMVFEYVAGSTLKHIVRSRGPLAPDAVIRLGRQLSAAIDTAHAAGVIHRDIKPDNILVGASGDAKLADFGVARVPDAALTREGQFLGTPCYAAPETIDRGAYGPHSDLFSFAAVMYEAISGVRAFPGDDAVSVAHKVVHDDPEPPSVVAPSARVPKEVDRAIMRGLSKSPEERYTSASELVDAVRAAYVAAGLLEDDGVSIPGASTGGSRARWVFPLVLIFALAIGVGLVYALGDFDSFGGGLISAEDAGVIDAGIDASVVVDAGDDAATDAAEWIVLIPDAGLTEPGEPDAGTTTSIVTTCPDPDGAKSALDRMRSALRAGNLEAASRELETARVCDPGDSDIPALEQQLHAAQGVTGS